MRTCSLSHMKQNTPYNIAIGWGDTYAEIIEKELASHSGSAGAVRSADRDCEIAGLPGTHALFIPISGAVTSLLRGNREAHRYAQYPLDGTITRGLSRISSKLNNKRQFVSNDMSCLLLFSEREKVNKDSNKDSLLCGTDVL